MKSKLFVALIGLSLLLTGVTPTFAAKGTKKLATTQQTTNGKHTHRHAHTKHKKLTKAEKKAIKHAVKKAHTKHRTTKA